MVSCFIGRFIHQEICCRKGQDRRRALNTSKPLQEIYEFRVEGALGEVWLEWFEGLCIREEWDAVSDCPVTVLSGPIPDQPALHGVIAKIRDLNLNLILVRKVSR
jgi:hypothetical protein